MRNLVQAVIVAATLVWPCQAMAQVDTGTPAIRVTPGARRQFTFADLVWSLSRDGVRSALARKGYAYLKTDEDGDMQFRGTILGEDARIWALFRDGRLAKVNVILLTADEDARKKYAELLETLTEKYGEPSASIEHYESPYYKGDGYEDQAVRMGKATIAAIWKADESASHGMGVQVTKALSVSVFYESSEWNAEADRRRRKSAKDF